MGLVFIAYNKSEFVFKFIQVETGRRVKTCERFGIRMINFLEFASSCFPKRIQRLKVIFDKTSAKLDEKLDITTIMETEGDLESDDVPVQVKDRTQNGFHDMSIKPKLGLGVKETIHVKPRGGIKRMPSMSKFRPKGYE